MGDKSMPVLQYKAGNGSDLSAEIMPSAWFKIRWHGGGKGDEHRVLEYLSRGGSQRLMKLLP